MSKEIIIDVREVDEYEAESIPGSLHVPLARFQSETKSVFASLPADDDIILMCRSGKRAAMARDHAAGLGYNAARKIDVFTGGILEWKRLNRPTIAADSGHFPIMRQVQIAAGTLVVLSVTLGYWVAPGFLAIGVFVGAGLMVAGITGFCGMANLLALAPWNRASRVDAK